ncbi:MAG: hypothetical protein KBT83_05150 [Marinobacter sp.]|nr:hypothetical protein [Marinobacter sp.]
MEVSHAFGFLGTSRDLYADFNHGFTQAHKFILLAEAELESYRFATAQFTQTLNKLHEFNGSAEL